MKLDLHPDQTLFSITRRYPHETYQVHFDKRDGRWFWEASGVVDGVRDDEFDGLESYEATIRHAAAALDESQDYKGRWARPNHLINPPPAP